MNYLWTDYREDYTYFTDEAPAIPCEERGNLSNSSKTVLINPMPRLAMIFLPLFDAFETQDVAVRHHLENVFCHFIAQLDRLCGKHDFSFLEKAVADEIKKGYYGERVSEIFQGLSVREQKIISRFLRIQEEKRGRISLYRPVIQSLFVGSRVYFYHDEKKLLVWLPYKESVGLQKKIELCNQLFLDVSCVEPEIFWSRHFGIIGVHATMRLDQTVIY